MAKNLTPEEWWRGILTGIDPALPAQQLGNIFRLMLKGKSQPIDVYVMKAHP